MSAPVRPTQREYWNGKVGEEWARQGDLMDRMLAPLSKPAFAALALAPGESVLDIGCGAGATALIAAREVGMSGRIVGVDISHPLLALARERAAAAGVQIAFLDADASAGAIAGEPFDAAFSRFGVMFFDDPPAAFARIRARLKPGGRFVFVCWQAFEKNIWSFAPLEALAPILRTPVPPPDPNAPGPFAFADAQKVQNLLRGAGWREISMAPWEGAFLVGGGGDADATAAFLLKIGPCARAISDQGLDPAEARSLLAAFLARHQTADGVSLPGACWIVRAVA